MRTTLSLLGVGVATVLLLVSAAMNWRYGFNLGKTELDGHIYGAASAAADGLLERRGASPGPARGATEPTGT